MAHDRKQAISERAYFLWEAEGRPAGEELDHWLRAEAEVSGGQHVGVTDNGKFVTRSEVEPFQKPLGRSGSA